MRTAGSLCIGNSAMAASLPDGSRVRGESHARFCERLEVKSLRPTHPTVPVLAKGKTRTGRLWTYVRDDRPLAGPDPPAAVFFYSPDRGGAHPEQHLAGYAGLMQADAYAGFDTLYETNRKAGPRAGRTAGASSLTSRVSPRRRSRRRRSSASMSCSLSSARSTVLLRRNVCVCARSVAAL